MIVRCLIINLILDRQPDSGESGCHFFIAMVNPKINLFWHRRDLRIDDNAGLGKALSGEFPVLPVFVFDKNILDHLPTKDARVQFIHEQLLLVKEAYQEHGSSLKVFYGTPETMFTDLLAEYDVQKVFTNRDYEPYAQKRDKAISTMLNEHEIEFIGAKDHVIFEKSEVVKDDGKPYTVFTPYSRKWKAALTPDTFSEHLSDFSNLLKTSPFDAVDLATMGFEPTEIEFPGKTVSSELLEKYGERRDIPGTRGTSRLSIHLRFGTVSIRELARKGQQHSESWLNELIWRDFYQMIIYHFPKSVTHEFKEKYSAIPWSNNMDHFEAWKKGKTGYPMVDAGMRELNKTGFMHNRVRMVVASFLTKHLLLDWRLGERYFAEKLLDFEVASNVGGWQWASGSGCDAAPYFRVFNPESQMKKFDPDLRYIKKWVPEYGTSSYPQPIVEHKTARQKAIDTYKEALS